MLSAIFYSTSGKAKESKNSLFVAFLNNLTNKSSIQFRVKSNSLFFHFLIVPLWYAIAIQFTIEFTIEVLIRYKHSIHTNNQTIAIQFTFLRFHLLRSFLKFYFFIFWANAEIRFFNHLVYLFQFSHCNEWLDNSLILHINSTYIYLLCIKYFLMHICSHILSCLVR